MSLSTRVLLGPGLGVVVGLFFGELVSPAGGRGLADDMLRSDEAP